MVAQSSADPKTSESQIAPDERRSDMTLKEFRKTGFPVGREFEVEGKSFWVDKSRGGRYFNTFIAGKMVTRATANTICKLIEAEVREGRC